MDALKFKVNDEVIYLGEKKELHGRKGKITHTRTSRKFETDIVQGEVQRPKDGFDYTITFLQSSGIKFILDVNEAEINY